MAGSFSTIEISADERVFTVRLNRPNALNAFNAEMSVELNAALRMAQRDDAIRCIVLTGSGRAFCSGQDLRDLRPPAAGDTDAEALDLGAHLRDAVAPVVLRLRTMEKPVVAAINGVAAGVGVSFALAADLRICAQSASFLMAFVHVGLIPDGAATLTLVQSVGYARALEMCLLGEKIPADRALEMGLVNRVVTDEELPAATRELATRLAALPTRALGLTKRALGHAWATTLDEQLRYEAFLQATAGQTADHREGVTAFLDKRPPRFAGK